MFTLKEKVVYPGYGVAQVSRIINKTVTGKSAQFFELKLLSKDMTVLVPVNNALSVGIRRLSSMKCINAIFKVLSTPTKRLYYESFMGNWNKRNKEYQGKLKTGDLHNICLVYKDLKYIEVRKELSFREKNLLLQIETLLGEEIALVQKIRIESAIQQLRSLTSHK